MGLFWSLIDMSVDLNGGLHAVIKGIKLPILSSVNIALFQILTSLLPKKRNLSVLLMQPLIFGCMDFDK